MPRMGDPVDTSMGLVERDDTVNRPQDLPPRALGMGRIDYEETGRFNSMEVRGTWVDRDTAQRRSFFPVQDGDDYILLFDLRTELYVPLPTDEFESLVSDGVLTLANASGERDSIELPEPDDESTRLVVGYLLHHDERMDANERFERAVESRVSALMPENGFLEVWEAEATLGPGRESIVLITFDSQQMVGDIVDRLSDEGVAIVNDVLMTEGLPTGTLSEWKVSVE